MSKLIWSLLLVSILVLGCAQDSTSPEVVEKIGDNTIFTSQDKGEQVKLTRKTAAKGRNAVAPDIDTGYGGRSYYDYGYRYHNAFLAFADYVRWLDYAITSVVKLQFGNDPSVYRIQAVTQTCWNFTITSPQPIKIEKIDQRSSVGNGTMIQTSTNTITVNWSVPSSAKGGLVFSLKSNQNDYCNDDWYWGSDPYANGYDGYWQDSYYYYPINPCASRHQQTSLIVKGSAVACELPNASTGASLLAAGSFNEDLSNYLNSYSGYMPSISRQVSGGELLSGRVVNFDGQDWWY